MTWQGGGELPLVLSLKGCTALNPRQYLMGITSCTLQEILYHPHFLVGVFVLQNCLNLCLLISVCYLQGRKDMEVGNPGLNMQMLLSCK